MKPLSITKLIWAAIVIAASYQGAQAGELIAVVDRNQVGSSETFRLQVSYDQQINYDQLDLSGLAKDFEVLANRPQSSSSTSTVNGRRTQTATTIWSIIFAPKRTGILTIPPFKIGPDLSRAIQIQVADAAQIESADQPLSVRVKSSVKTAFPGQQIFIEVELSAQNGVTNLNGPELVVANADVVPIDQQSTQRVDNGLARNIVTLSYAVFAKSEGEIVIPVMTYTANKGGGRSLFASRGEQVLARSRQIKINVQAAPRQPSAPWFPAENVALSSTWSRDPSELKVGEPITRTITVTAVAQQSSAIPPLLGLPDSSDYNHYSDQPQLDDKTSSRGFVGTRVESVAIVAQREGELTIPETRLSWFDVGAKRWKEAVLPAETINASGAVVRGTAPVLSLDNTSTIISERQDTHDAARPWQIATAALATLALLQLLVIFKMRASHQLPRPISHAQNVSEAKAWKELQSALKNESAVALRKALVSWLNAALPSSTSWTLQDMSALSDNTVLNDELIRLESTLFDRATDPSSDRFNAVRLAGAMQEFRSTIQQQRVKSKPDQLSQLYDSQ